MKSYSHLSIEDQAQILLEHLPSTTDCGISLVDLKLQLYAPQNIFEFAYLHFSFSKDWKLCCSLDMLVEAGVVRRVSIDERLGGYVKTGKHLTPEFFMQLQKTNSYSLDEPLFA